MVKVIYLFNRDDKYYPLSNFSVFGFVLDGNKWRTMEHYFQAMKFDGLYFLLAIIPSFIFVLV